MYLDVVDLREFYSHHLGHVARRMIRRRVHALWPDLRGQSLLGVGYALPYLAPYIGDGTRVLAAMPASQGVLHWPTRGPNASFLMDESALPLEDASVDRILCVHALENTEQRQGLMDELWRVLSGQGRLLIVVPNRRGLWARFDHTPFGHGQPYTMAQLSKTLRNAHFTPTRMESALFVPPVTSQILSRSTLALEGVGRRFFSTFAGAILIEAQKQVYAVRKDRRPVFDRARKLWAPARPNVASTNKDSHINPHSTQEK